MTDENPTPTAPKSPRRRWLGVIALALVSLFAMGSAFAGGPLGHRAMHKQFKDDPDAAAAWVAARLANQADASAEQEEVIRGTLEDLFAELGPMRAEKEAFRQDVKDALTADTVDPQLLEELRTEGIEQADFASKVVTQALADIASELTPEQRNKLADDLEQMRERWHGR